ncbi:hypothetical protein EYF80_004609 [Liparis tanakae]|uniref:Uncharacterized protein n=1 Tax=Liparis tanakae TaxID=230148 RepID=A0A4Z2J4X9_9TELE|nr:hypothetical protein EYF80_004609 [Liparis tanakae]
MRTPHDGCTLKQDALPLSVLGALCSGERGSSPPASVPSPSESRDVPLRTIAGRRRWTPLTPDRETDGESDSSAVQKSPVQ